jgi:quercetin dioxygenase-like cupin family protein
MSHYDPSELAAIPINDSVAIKVVPGKNSTLLLATLAKGGKVPRHRHPHEQVSYVLKGAISVSVGESDSSVEREYAVRAGEVSVLPPDVPHELSALEDTVLIDVFSPARADLAKFSKPSGAAPEPAR